MKHSNKRVKCKAFTQMICLLVVVFVCFTSCKAGPKVPDNDTSPTVSITEGVDPNSNIDTAITPKFIELKIYTVNATSNGVIPATQLVHGEDITPDFVVECVIDSLEDSYYFIDVLDVSTDEGGTIVVEFASDTPPCYGVESDLEIAILDSFAQSLLDNLIDYNKVIYRTDGGNYVSDNREYLYDYIYLEN